MLIITITTGISVLSPVIGMSLFLFREFALDGVLLQQKLQQVESLSAQTIAQEQEKQQILSDQNERLELQVAERTAELRHSLDELELEAALDRVRVRTAAMQKSEELREVIQVIFRQLVDLGFEISNAGFLMDFRNTDDQNLWMADVYDDFPTKICIPYIDHPQMRRLKEAKEQGLDLLAHTLTLEEKNSFFTYCFSLIKMPEEVRQAVFDSPGLATSVALLKNVALYLLNSSGVPYSETENAILLRFGQVFEQTYTRFKDLDHAEAQTRESQIQLALERVRARTAAMQKSEELAQVIQVVYEQLVQLGFEIHNAGFLMDYRHTNDYNVWTADAFTDFPTRIHVPYFDHPINRDYLETRNNETLLFTRIYSFEEKNTWLDSVWAHIQNPPEEARNAVLNAPALALTRVLLKEVALYTFNYLGKLYSDAENATLIRFGQVFEQTYTRFKDLEQAEAQAREAQIQLALERVRARSMAMQKSDELAEMIQLIFDQFMVLGLHVDTANFAPSFWTNPSELDLWLASPAQKYPAKITLPIIDHPIFNSTYDAYKKGVDFYADQYTFEEKNSFIRHFFEHVSGVSEERKQQLLDAPGFARSVTIAKNMALSITNYDGIPYTEQENQILKRFGVAFNQAYTRFLDLQNAEALATEAIKQASVDRVRAEIASMRTTADLQRITPVIWNELTALGVPFIRSGVFIVDEETKQIHTYLSTPDGRALASIDVPFDSNLALGIAQHVMPAWRKKQITTIHWSAEEFAVSTKTLVDSGRISKKDRMVTEHPDTTLDLHFFPFLQGMLYVGNPAPLNKGEMDLAQSLAEAFSTAYARYEDFKKLEAAKAQVENTLTELRSAQTQLVQREKMASLGELTAGIAHEIQNPLNFVNNFSEVNAELIEEMELEIDKGDLVEVKAIAGDIKVNQQKISQHGKRADFIVKGMLEHSRTSTGEKQETNINVLADEYLKLSYHGLRAKDKSFNAELVTDFDTGLHKVDIVQQDIGRVLLNLYNNAFYAVSQKAKGSGGNYKPTVEVRTAQQNGSVIISVKDNGNGIPDAIKDKIMQPFFTTKPTGEGTGLGLSLSYDIVVKGHGGKIDINSKEGEGSEFIISLPR